jgi:hypothetical protein
MVYQETRNRGTDSIDTQLRSADALQQSIADYEMAGISDVKIPDMRAHD